MFQSHLGSIQTKKFLASLKKAASVSIPPWFDSNFLDVLDEYGGIPVFQSHLGSIQTFLCDFALALEIKVSIPPWFDSNHP